MNNKKNKQDYFEVLRKIQSEPKSSQRDLAEKLGFLTEQCNFLDEKCGLLAGKCRFLIENAVF